MKWGMRPSEFGGARISWGGTKAAGCDYLLHFMDPLVVSENTVRRGFAPLSVKKRS